MSDEKEETCRRCGEPAVGYIGNGVYITDLCRACLHWSHRNADDSVRPGRGYHALGKQARS